MPLYEFRCRACGATFDALRSVDTADDEALCPDGHVDTVRLLSLVAPARREGAATTVGGGCGGGGCGCACGA
jgi:putative FmdB family regulatory protein